MALYPGETQAPDDETGFTAAQAQANYDVPTSDYLSSKYSASFYGPGSASRLLEDINIRAMRGSPIAKEDYIDGNPAYDPRIKYFDGMNDANLPAMSKQLDFDAGNNEVAQKSSWLQSIATLPLRAGELLEPLQLGEMAATAAITGGVGSVLELGAANSVRVAALSKAIDSSPYALRLAGAAVGEGTTFTALSQPAQIEGADMQQTDYGMRDFLVQSAANSLLIGTLHGAFKYFGKGAEDIKNNPQTFDNVKDQIVNGVTPDLEAAVAPQMLQQKADIQTRLDMMNKQKEDAATQDSRNYDAINDYENQKLAITHGLDNVDPTKLPDLVDAVKAVRDEAITPTDSPRYADVKEQAEDAANLLRQNGIDPAQYSEGLARGKTYGEIGAENGVPIDDYNRAAQSLRDLKDQRATERDQLSQRIEDEGLKKPQKKLDAFDAETQRATDNLQSQIDNFRQTHGDEKIGDIARAYSTQKTSAPKIELSKDAKSQIKDIDGKISDLKNQITGPDVQESLRQKIADHESQLSRFPTDRELAVKTGAELNRRIDTKNQATYRSAELEKPETPEHAPKADDPSALQKEVDALQAENPEVSEKFAEIDEQNERQLKAIDAAIGCLKRG